MEGRRPSLRLAWLMVVLIVGSATLPLLPILPVRARGLPAAPTAYQNVSLSRQGLVVPTGPPGSFDELQAGRPSVLFDGLYRMWYFACTTSYLCQIAYATSFDGWTWTKAGPVLSPVFSEETYVAYPWVAKVGSEYRMWYGGSDGGSYRIFAASSSDGRNWTRLGLAVDIGPPGSQDAYQAVAPSVVYTGGEYLMWYMGVSSPTPTSSAIMLASSSDGMQWTKHGVVLDAGVGGSPDSFGTSFPGVAMVHGTFVMFYSGYSDAVTARVMYAESSDGSNWTRRGVALDPLPSVEPLIYAPNLMVAENGTWLVYYMVRVGASDLQIFLATYSPPSPVGPTSLDLTLLLFALIIAAAGTLFLVLVVFVLRPERPPRRR